jgi:mycofactocin precursor
LTGRTVERTSEETMSDPKPQSTVEREPDAALTSRNEHDEQPEPLVEDEVLVEDLSIDGMCGVY